MSLGVPQDSPEVEAARQTILRGCIAHNVACGMTPTSAADAVRRLDEGWKMIRSTEAIIREARAALDRR
jgi:hypothetical protein